MATDQAPLQLVQTPERDSAIERYRARMEAYDALPLDVRTRIDLARKAADTLRNTLGSELYSLDDVREMCGILAKFADVLDDLIGERGA